jgi:cell division protease FtsH
MNSALGLATLDGAHQPPFLQAPGERLSCSEETSRLIDEQTRKMLDDAYGRARETLLAKRSVLNAIAAVLLEKEVVDRDTLDRLLSASDPAPSTDAARPAPGSASPTFKKFAQSHLDLAV